MEHNDTKSCGGKLQGMDRYSWNILGLCEMRWKNFCETAIEEGHKVFFSGKEDKHEHGIGFLVHTDIMTTVVGCHPISSGLITTCLRAVPFNITVAQANAPTSDYNDNEIKEFYDQLQNAIDQTPKDILVVQADRQKWARMHVKTGKAFVDPSAMMTQMRTQTSGVCHL